MKWILLIYKLPRSKTTAQKVALWRKLKKLAVYSLQDSVGLLPSSEKNLETFEWIAAELREAGGDASVWEAETLTVSREKEIKDHFVGLVNVEYRRIMEEVVSANTEEDLRLLWMQYNQVKVQDYLRSPLATEARAACEARAESFKKGEV